MQFLDIFGHFALFVPAHGWPLNPTSAFIDKNVITGCCCNDIYGKRATPGYYHPIFPPFAWKLNFWSKVEAGGGGWWTVWSQTPPITLKLGRCAQGHNWVRIVSECRDILMLWYFQPPLLHIININGLNRLSFLSENYRAYELFHIPISIPCDKSRNVC